MKTKYCMYNRRAKSVRKNFRFDPDIAKCIELLAERNHMTETAVMTYLVLRESKAKKIIEEKTVYEDYHFDSIEDMPVDIPSHNELILQC